MLLFVVVDAAVIVFDIVIAAVIVDVAVIVVGVPAVVSAVAVAVAVAVAATDHRRQCSCANLARGANSKGSQQAPFAKRKGCPIA